MTIEATKPWYIGERAEQTVLLWLTEVDTADNADRDPGQEAQPDQTVTVETNVVVERGEEYAESDFRVTLCDRDKKASFFVDVKGTTDTHEWITNGGIFNSKKYMPSFRAVRRLKGAVAVVVVNVKNREAYFGWVVPPTGCSSILSSEPAQMRLATKSLLSEIFDEVMPGFWAKLTKLPPTRPGPVRVG